jgi:hypothetical protein
MSDRPRIVTTKKTEIKIGKTSRRRKNKGGNRGRPSGRQGQMERLGYWTSHIEVKTSKEVEDDREDV